MLVFACANGDAAVDGTGGGDGTGSEGGAGTPPDESDGGIVFLDAGLSHPDPDSGGSTDGGSSADASASCGYPNTCATGKDLGSVSGDTGSATVTTTGTSSEWTTIYVTEDDNSAVGRKLQLKVTLDVAAGTSYALYVYRNANNNTKAPECTSTSGQNMAPPSATLGLSWGEGLVANGVDDSSMVTVRVEHVSGPCDATHPWTVTLTGNTQ